MKESIVIGVLALQGGFSEHIDILNKLNIDNLEVKNKDDLEKIDGIILPGGESTAISLLLHEFNMFNSLKEKIQDGLPVYGSCAGLILLAKDLIDYKPHLEVMDISVKRNGFGRQLGSFSFNQDLEEFGEKINMVFIRAPYIEKITSQDVKILATVKDKIVSARQKNILVTSFHPELIGETRIHEYFINKMILKR